MTLRFAMLIGCAVGTCLAVVPADASAQQATSAATARSLLASRPDLVAQLRQEIAKSGLTPDQIRARLRAAGYAEDLLDAYLGPRRTTSDAAATPVVSEELLDAVAALGVTDSVSTGELRELLRRRRDAGLVPDSARLQPADSLAVDSAGPPDRLEQRLRRPRPDSLGGDSTVGPRRRPRFDTMVDSGMTLFGLSVFAAATTQFDANLAGAVDATYRLGPGDRIVLLITGDAERAYTLEVTREGFVVIPGVGQLFIANLTLGELERLLHPALARVFSGIRRDASATTRFSVTVARLRTNQVAVLGDVAMPGSYRVSGAGTALTALYAAGGPSKSGSLRRVEIRRGGKVADTLDLYDYLLHGDTSHDPRLQNGDVIFVPVHGARVRVFGEVVRPATYELRRGETLADALRQAGGFSAEAARRRVQIQRILPPTQRDTTDRARVLLDVSSDDFATGTGPAYPLEAGDVIRVFAVSERVGRRVSVGGAVWTPGPLGFTPGMRLSDALRRAGGLKPEAYRGQVLISRLREADGTRVQLRAALADSTGRAVEDLALHEDDDIRVFSMADFRTPEFVAITGAVRRAGRFAFREGMTLRDLVLLAGGLDGRASLEGAEIARQPPSREGGRLAMTMPVALDSSYLVSRGAGRRAAPAAGVTEIVLQPFDNVLVAPQQGWATPRSVAVQGEVRRPGSYLLTGKGDRLRDVLARAGGLTASADSGSVRFHRAQGRVGRIGLDLRRVLRDARDDNNLLLQDGDSVYLPAYSGVVEVQGAVGAPRGVSYRPGASLMYYVRAAGGTTSSADLGRAYLTQSDGTVASVVQRRFLPDGRPTPRAGAVIFVPERSTSERTSDPVAWLGVLAQIVGSVVAIVAITRR